MKRMMMIDRESGNNTSSTHDPISLFLFQSPPRALLISVHGLPNPNFPDHRIVGVHSKGGGTSAHSYSSFAFRARSIRFLWPTHHA